LKEITFDINHEAYTINIGEDPDGELEKTLKKFLSTEKNIDTKELLLAYLKRTEEMIQLKEKVRALTLTIPSLEKFSREKLK
jgi:hypothetical protein